LLRELGLPLWKLPRAVSSLRPRMSEHTGTLSYIGDEIRDAEAAGKARVAFGAVPWGQHSKEALRAQNPAAVFTSLQQISDNLCLM